MKYFTENELTRSAMAEKLGIDNSPTPEAIKNLESLVCNVLDPLREKFGRPILVNSGYRCSELNKADGGAKDSDHLFGMAADITSGTRYGNQVLFDMKKKYFDYHQ